MAAISVPNVDRIDLRITPEDASSLARLQPVRRGDRWYRYRLFAADAAALVLIGVVWFAFGGAPVVAAVAIVVDLLLFRTLSLYATQTTPSALDQCWPVMVGTAVGALVGAAAGQAPAAIALAYAAVSAAAVCLARAAALRHERSRVIAHPRKVLLAGSGPAAQEFADRLLRHPEYGMTPVGFVDTDAGPIDPKLRLPVLGNIDLLAHLADEYDVERIVVDAEAVPEEEVLRVLDRAAGVGVEVAVLPILARQLSTAVTVEGVAGMTLLSYRRRPHRGVAWRTKRLLDVVLGTVLLVLSAPVWLAAALAIKIDSRGPVLFHQERVGRHGRRFQLVKLRSMVVDAEQRRSDLLDLNAADGPYFKAVRDPRVTRVGRVLRRLSIDELPQLLNVLRGDMSLVGPRPALPEEVENYPVWFRRRLAVTPGLTGLWQVSGRFLLPFHEAARLDVFYVDHWSLGLDVKILARTPAVMLSGRGAR